MFKLLNSYQLSYAYHGAFTSTLTDKILALSETNLDVESESLKIKKKVYFIIVESLQNLTRHKSSEIDSTDLDSFFAIHKLNDGYLVGSANTIENDKILPLSEKLDKVNSLNQEDLKNYQHEVLSASGFSEKGGAGLGLIEMVRKSGNKLSYGFEKINEKNSYFYFQTKITDISANIGSNEITYNHQIIKTIHKVVHENNLKVFFQGQFKHENVKSLLSMAEISMYLTENFAFRKTAVSIMIELLQNIAFHAVGINNNDDRPGMFMVSNKDNVCSFITGNYVTDVKLAELSKKLEHVNSLNDIEITDLYLETLVLENDDSNNSAGLGFIDIRAKSKNKIELDIYPFSDDKKFVIIKANINY